MIAKKVRRTEAVFSCKNFYYLTARSFADEKRG